MAEQEHIARNWRELIRPRGVSIDQDTAWRLFTKGIRPKTTQAGLRLEGDAALGERILQMVSIMA